MSTDSTFARRGISLTQKTSNLECMNGHTVATEAGKCPQCGADVPPWYMKDNGHSILSGNQVLTGPYIYLTQGDWWLCGVTGKGIYYNGSKTKVPPEKGWRAGIGAAGVACMPTLRLKYLCICDRKCLIFCGFWAICDRKCQNNGACEFCGGEGTVGPDEVNKPLERVLRIILDTKCPGLPYSDTKNMIALGVGPSAHRRAEFVKERRRLTSDAADYGFPPTDGCEPWKAVSPDEPSHQRVLRRLMASEAGYAC